MSAVDFTPYLVGAFLLWLVWFTHRQVKAFHAEPRSVGNGTRTDQRIPERERELLGDSFTDIVEERIATRRRRDAIVNGVCHVGD